MEVFVVVHHWSAKKNMFFLGKQLFRKKHSNNKRQQHTSQHSHLTTKKRTPNSRSPINITPPFNLGIWGHLPIRSRILMFEAVFFFVSLPRYYGSACIWPATIGWVRNGGKEGKVHMLDGQQAYLEVIKPLRNKWWWIIHAPPEV